MNCVNCQARAETAVGLCLECYKSINRFPGHMIMKIHPKYKTDEFWAKLVTAPGRPVWLDPMVEHGVTHIWAPDDQVNVIVKWTDQIRQT